MSRRGGTANKTCHDGTGRYIFFARRDVDGAHSFSRRDGTVYNLFHDGEGRYFFFSTARAVYPCFHDGTGRHAYLVTAAQEGERSEEHTALCTKAAVLQCEVIRRIYDIIYTCNINGYYIVICNLQSVNLVYM